MSHAETTQMDSVDSIELSAAKLVLSDETIASILIENPVEQEHDQKNKVDVHTCRAGNGWCKNVCKEGQTICEECTKMMDSYP
jgi:hypothetical protein